MRCLFCFIVGGRRSEVSGSLTSRDGKDATIDLDDSDEDTVPVTPITAKTGADLGSTKKNRRKQRRILNETEEIGFGEENPIAAGFQQAGLENFLAFDRRHLLVKSSITDFTNSLMLQKKPTWLAECKAWTKEIVSSGLKAQGVFKDGKAQPLGADAAFCYLPTGLRGSQLEEGVPAFNVWDTLITEKVFKFMNKYLSDNGLFALLHSGEYEHLLVIADACTKTGYFRIASSSIVLTTEPQWKPKREFQVF